MDRGAETSVVAAVLERALANQGTQQIFVFGPEGAPFWAARTPVLQDDVAHLERALRIIEQLEPSQPKPFFACAPGGEFHLAALDAEEDLYVVVLARDPDPVHAEARVRRVLLELAPHATSFRREGRALANSAARN